MYFFTWLKLGINKHELLGNDQSRFMILILKNWHFCVSLYKYILSFVQIRYIQYMWLSLVTWYETISSFRIIFTGNFPFIWALRNKKRLFFHGCFVYRRFLNLRSAGWGVPLVPFSWVHPEVTQTPGGPLRPGWPLNPGLPTWPLSPGFPGWPSNALPGRPGRPVVETWNGYFNHRTAGKTILLPPTHHLVRGLQRNQESHNPWSPYHLALLAHLQIKHPKKYILNVNATEVRTLTKQNLVPIQCVPCVVG